MALAHQNNLAEYAALIAVLRHLIDVGLQREHIVVIGDSQLVINQMFGNWKIKRRCYVDVAREAKALLAQFHALKASGCHAIATRSRMT